MKSAGQKSEHVLVISGGLLATRPHADPGCSVPAHEVDGDLAQDGQIAGRGPIPTRLSSSRNVTSRTQWSPFSIVQ
jgi:hypothetical protein